MYAHQLTTVLPRGLWGTVVDLNLELGQGRSHDTDKEKQTPHFQSQCTVWGESKCNKVRYSKLM